MCLPCNVNNLNLNLSVIGKNTLNKWLSTADICPETEGFLLAIQNQVIFTKYYRKFIIKDGTASDTCRGVNETAKL